MELPNCRIFPIHAHEAEVWTKNVGRTENELRLGKWLATTCYKVWRLDLSSWSIGLAPLLFDSNTDEMQKRRTAHSSHAHRYVRPRRYRMRWSQALTCGFCRLPSEFDKATKRLGRHQPSWASDKVKLGVSLIFSSRPSKTTCDVGTIRQSTSLRAKEEPLQLAPLSVPSSAELARLRLQAPTKGFPGTRRGRRIRSGLAVKPFFFFFFLCPCSAEQYPPTVPKRENVSRLRYLKDIVSLGG